MKCRPLQTLNHNVSNDIGEVKKLNIYVQRDSLSGGHCIFTNRCLISCDLNHMVQVNVSLELV